MHTYYIRVYIRWSVLDVCRCMHKILWEHCNKKSSENSERLLLNSSGNKQKESMYERILLFPSYHYPLFTRICIIYCDGHKEDFSSSFRSSQFCVIFMIAGLLIQSYISALCYFVLQLYSGLLLMIPGTIIGRPNLLILYVNVKRNCCNILIIWFNEAEAPVIANAFVYPYILFSTTFPEGIDDHNEIETTSRCLLSRLQIIGEILNFMI